MAQSVKERLAKLKEKREQMQARSAASGLGDDEASSKSLKLESDVAPTTPAGTADVPAVVVELAEPPQAPAEDTNKADTPPTTSAQPDPPPEEPKPPVAVAVKERSPVPSSDISPGDYASRMEDLSSSEEESSEGEESSTGSGSRSSSSLYSDGSSEGSLMEELLNHVSDGRPAEDAREGDTEARVVPRASRPRLNYHRPVEMRSVEQLCDTLLSVKTPVVPRPEYAMRPWQKKSVRAVDRYERIARISEGVYGTVYKGKDRTTGELFALKVIKQEWIRESHTGFPPYLLREINMLLRLNHPNVVKGREVLHGRRTNTDEEMVVIVMDFAGRDLKTIVRRMPHLLQPAQVNHVLHDVLTGLAYLHDHSILHRDLKCSNILINETTGAAQICDFGLTRVVERRSKLTPEVVTLMYRAPELHFKLHDYHDGLDMWSVGCIWAEMLLKKPLFPASVEAEHLAKVCKVIGTPTNDVFPGFMSLRGAHEAMDILDGNAKFRGRDVKHRLRRYVPESVLSDTGFDLLQRMLSWNPGDRPTAHEALNHPFFRCSDTSRVPFEFPPPAAPAAPAAPPTTVPDPQSQPQGASGTLPAPPAEVAASAAHVTT